MSSTSVPFGPNPHERLPLVAVYSWPAVINPEDEAAFRGVRAAVEGIMACAYMGAGADRRVRVYDEIPRRDPDESPEAGELAFSNYYFYRPANSPPELQPDERSTIRKIGNIANRGWTAALPELGKMGIPPEALALRAGNLVVIRIPEII